MPRGVWIEDGVRRGIANMAMDDIDHDEIALHMGVSKRSVERIHAEALTGELSTKAERRPPPPRVLTDECMEVRSLKKVLDEADIVPYLVSYRVYHQAARHVSRRAT
jgi:hypothetical protein